MAGPTWSDPIDATAFRVCADPNNLPFSNSDGAGFENKLAELIAHDLGQHVPTLGGHSGAVSFATRSRPKLAMW